MPSFRMNTFRIFEFHISINYLNLSFWKCLTHKRTITFSQLDLYFHALSQYYSLSSSAQLKIYLHPENKNIVLLKLNLWILFSKFRSTLKNSKRSRTATCQGCGNTFWNLLFQIFHFHFYQIVLKKCKAIVLEGYVLYYPRDGYQRSNSNHPT